VLIEVLTALGIGSAAKGIEFATSGKQALTMIRKAIEADLPYDLMLLDWVMPEMDGYAVLQNLRDSGLAPLPLSVVVSAYDTEAMHEIAESLGAQHFLPKPVLPEALRRLINALTGKTDDESSYIHDSRIDINFNGMRVLLVEDNPINQQLAVELLESRGIKVVVANNGQEALDKLAAFASDHFHVVLMDLQMPVMDGYEATRRLRSDPRYFSLPLVAMTAHAMLEERQKCLALGMNDHLSKPIEPDDLYAMLARFFTAPTNSIVDTVSLGTQPVIPSGDIVLPNIAGLDIASGLRRAANNRKLYSQSLSRFVNDFAEYKHTFTSYLANAEWNVAERLAHTLKGLASTLGANDVSLAASKLETVCKGKQAETAAAVLIDLMTLLTPLLTALQQHFAEEQASKSMVAELTAESGELPDCTPQLLQLLNEGDSHAIELWEMHHQEFSRSLSPHAAELITIALQNFEFDTAQKLLTELSAKVPSSETLNLVDKP